VTSEQEATALGRLAENSSNASSYWAVVQLQAEQRGSVQVAATGGQGGAAKVSGAGLRRAARWRGEVRSGRLRSSSVGLGSRDRRRGRGAVAEMRQRLGVQCVGAVTAEWRRWVAEVAPARWTARAHLE